MKIPFTPFLRKRGTRVTYEVTGTGSFEVTYAVGDPLKGEEKHVKAGVTPWKQEVAMSGIGAMPIPDLAWVSQLQLGRETHPGTGGAERRSSLRLRPDRQTGRFWPSMY
ncbi:hypothetical protein ACWENO_29270 [Streptomyces sp. NPDC004436]